PPLPFGEQKPDEGNLPGGKVALHFQPDRLFLPLTAAKGKTRALSPSVPPLPEAGGKAEGAAEFADKALQIRIHRCPVLCGRYDGNPDAKKPRGSPRRNAGEKTPPGMRRPWSLHFSLCRQKTLQRFS